ncbi:MAG: hypothetical protein SFW66_02815 [Gammaproteobacteria bacterium]|nr:hypothetical protein [Gammaproteobacteria bacterium]
MSLKLNNVKNLVELIESEFSTEMNYYATPDVAVTAHAVGDVDSANWTQILFERKIISSLPPSSKGDRFIELERSLTSLYCFSLQGIEPDEAYDAFIDAQRNNPDVLTKDSFKRLYNQINSIINNKDKSDILKRLIIYSDLGKSPQFRRVVKELSDKEIIKIDTSLDPDDLMTEILFKLNDHQLTTVLPSFLQLSPHAKETLRKIYPIMQACFGHIYFLERGELTFQTISQALGKIPTEERGEALDLVYLSQLYDGFGAQGQRQISGSLTCTENFYLGYLFIYESLLKLIQQLNATENASSAANDAFQNYLHDRAQLLGFKPPLSSEQQFLTRMGCMLRGFTPEFGKILIDEYGKLPNAQKKLLITQLNFSDQGLEGWTKAHYIATVPQNVSRSLFENNNVHDAIAQAIKSTVCFSMLTEEMRNRYASFVTDRSRVISFGEIAFLSSKSPELFDPNIFNPTEYMFNPNNNKIMKIDDKKDLIYKNAATLCHFKPADESTKLENRKSTHFHF